MMALWMQIHGKSSLGSHRRRKVKKFIRKDSPFGPGMRSLPDSTVDPSLRTFRVNA
jgi:hypothetical protein